MPLILVTNDDGVTSEGIHALADAMRPLGDVLVVAPLQEASAIGHALTLRRPLRIETISDGVYGVDGTPTDCVNLGVRDPAERAAAGSGRLGHQQGLEPRRRHHLLGHRVGRARRRAARAAGHCRLAEAHADLRLRAVGGGRGDGRGGGARARPAAAHVHQHQRAAGHAERHARDDAGQAQSRDARSTRAPIRAATPTTGSRKRSTNTTPTAAARITRRSGKATSRSRRCSLT